MNKDDTGNFKKILNFPIKKHWKNPSQKSYVELVLQNFVYSYKKKWIQGITFPLLGAVKGGLDTKWC